MFREYVDLEQYEKESVQKLPTMDSRNQQALDISNIYDQPDPHFTLFQDDPESFQRWVDPPTIQPRQLDSMSQALSQYNPLSTSNKDNSQKSPSPSTKQPNISIQPKRRLRRIQPAPAHESKGATLGSSPSWTDTSSSASSASDPAMEGSGRPTPQANIQSGTDLTCHCGFKAKTPSSLR